MNVAQPSSQTHCQTTQANILTKTRQRVCLHEPKMKEKN